MYPYMCYTCMGNGHMLPDGCEFRLLGAQFTVQKDVAWLPGYQMCNADHCASCATHVYKCNTFRPCRQHYHMCYVVM